MNFCPQFPRPVSPELFDSLKSLGHFIYYPNPGNAGDSLIAASTQLLFEKMGLSYEFYDEQKEYGSGYSLVYGGGGGLVPEWGLIPGVQQILCAPQVGRCVILPHSIRNCPEFLNAMDERFTVFLREKQAYDYAISHHSRAVFHLAHDMAFYMDVASLQRTLQQRQLPLTILGYIWFKLRQKFSTRSGAATGTRTITPYRFRRRLHNNIRKHMPACMQTLPGGRKVAWFMRTDCERTTNITSHSGYTFDLSLIHGSCCNDSDINMLLALIFLKTIEKADIIITDRLHVSIGAAIMNKQVIMLDNSYGKLSGVWELSMKDLPHVHFCPSDAQFASLLERVCHPTSKPRK